jgi:hypothetical protein
VRERQILRPAVALVMMCGCAAALVVGYHVEPIKAPWSGWTRTTQGQDYVSEVITINFDELDSAAGGCYCELFAGSKGGGGAYYLSVLTYPGGSQIADVATANGDVDHEWVRFYLNVTGPESIIKGKKLTFKFTRSGGDSIRFCYDSTDKAESLDSGPSRPRMA